MRGIDVHRVLVFLLRGPAAAAQREGDLVLPRSTSVPGFPFRVDERQHGNLIVSAEDQHAVQAMQMRHDHRRVPRRIGKHCLGDVGIENTKVFHADESFVRLPVGLRPTVPMHAHVVPDEQSHGGFAEPRRRRPRTLRHRVSRLVVDHGVLGLRYVNARFGPGHHGIAQENFIRLWPPRSARFVFDPTGADIPENAHIRAPHHDRTRNPVTPQGRHRTEGDQRVGDDALDFLPR